MLKGLLVFSKLPEETLKKLAECLEEESFNQNDAIVREGEAGDRLYVIVQGKAEVTTASPSGPLILASLGKGEIFGELALLAPRKERKATVTATTLLQTYSLKRETFENLIATHPDIKQHLNESAEILAITKFLKQATPFTALDAASTLRLAKRLKSLTIAAGEEVIRQGEKGDTCYLIRSGRAEVISKGRSLAILEAGSLFGEAALLTAEPRNATVRTLESSQLLTLHRSDLVEVLGIQQQLDMRILELMRLRDRPVKKPGILTQENVTQDCETVVTLKDPEQATYFRLSKQGWFVWQKLNGDFNLRDLTLEYFSQFKIFSPQTIAETLANLADAGFIVSGKLRDDVLARSLHLSKWLSLAQKLRRVFEWRVAINNIDPLIHKLYSGLFWRFYTKRGQIAAGAFAISGLMIFAMATPTISSNAFFQSNFYTVIAMLLFAGAITTVIHELGHALTVKAFGREIPQAGIGWYWLGPIAFVDTSDMWLSGRWPRIAVSLAGPYSGILLATLGAFMAYLLKNSSIGAASWIFTAAIYISTLVNLNPMMEYDGYYVLMDLLEQPNLRKNSFHYLFNEFPRAWKSHRWHILYGLGSLLYVLGITVLAWFFYGVICRNWIANKISGPFSLGLGLVVAGGIFFIHFISVISELQIKTKEI